MTETVEIPLVERVEWADPSDWRALRALAKDIYCELHGAPELSMSSYGWREDDSGWWLETGEDQRCPRKRIDPPAWPTSLDAAMSLLPETDAATAVFWKLGNDGEGGDPALFKATVLVAHVFTSKTFSAVADTAPLALTAACLKSRTLTQGEEK